LLVFNRFPYTTLFRSGLWRIPTTGGDEVELLNSMEGGYWGYWAVVDEGIYYLDTTTKPAIAFFNISTHRSTRVFDLENRPARGRSEEHTSELQSRVDL